LRSHSPRKVRITLMRQGPGPVLARHIDVPSNVELVNPDHYICTLDGNESRIEIEFTVDKGRGYVPAEMGDIAAIGEIPIDAIFTPVPKVNYVVENTRVGQATNYDRLIIEIFTDGTIKPGDALIHSAQVLVQYNKIISEFSRVSIEPIDDGQILASVVDSNAIPSTIMEMSVDALELTTRTHNCLRRADITSIGQILQMDEKQLKAVRNLGEKSLDEIKDKVREKCLKYNYDPGGKWSSAAEESTSDIETE